MNIEIINSLKQRAKEMLENNYNRKIGDEEVYTIICELENFYTAYEKEKNKEPTFLIKDIYSPKLKEINLQDVEGLIEQGKEEVRDKIKEKIEELKDGTYDAKIVLQSLLEKDFPTTITKEELEKRWKE